MSSGEEESATAVPAGIGRVGEQDVTAVGQGMFQVHGTGDTSGFGGLVRTVAIPSPAQRPYGGYFDEVVDGFSDAYPAAADAITSVVVDRGELTMHISAEHIAGVLSVMRDEPGLRFELCASVSGVDYGPEVPQRFHVVYELHSMTFRRHVRLEVSVGLDVPHVPTATGVYPTADWQERECFDMYGVIFDGHPGLTRIFMPDDWDGHPQRKDYPLGGISVEYKDGASIPPPDQRRSYT